MCFVKIYLTILQRLDWGVQKTINREGELDKWARVYGNEVDSTIDNHLTKYMVVKDSVRSRWDKDKSDQILPSRNLKMKRRARTLHKWL